RGGLVGRGHLNVDLLQPQRVRAPLDVEQYRWKVGRVRRRDRSRPALTDEAEPHRLPTSAVEVAFSLPEQPPDVFARTSEFDDRTLDLRHSCEMCRGIRVEPLRLEVVLLFHL